MESVEEGVCENVPREEEIEMDSEKVIVSALEMEKVEESESDALIEDESVIVKEKEGVAVQALTPGPAGQGTQLT